MYLKKVDGPRSVKLPDGSRMTRADLPPENTRRWVASRKLAVVHAVLSGLITRDHAQNRYNLSEEELTEWIAGAAEMGRDGLKATQVQRLRAKRAQSDAQKEKE